MPIPTTPPSQKKSLLKKNWQIYFFAGAFMILIVSTIIRYFTPKSAPIQNNSWGQITPGYSKIDQAITQFGQPLGEKQTEKGNEYYFKSDFKVSPNVVISDNSGTVKFMKQYLLYDEANTVENYVDKYGNPDLVLIDQSVGDAYKAHIFLKYGLVLIAHILDNSISQIWYFEPTSKDVFLKSWGSDLSDQIRSPEKMVDPNLLYQNNNAPE